jgi:hypothetical protein
MKTQLRLLLLIFALAICCLATKTMQAQTAYAIDATYEANTLNAFDLSTTSVITTFGTPVPVDYYVTGGAWANDTWYISYIDFETFESYLGSINVTTGSLTTIGSAGVFLFDLAYDATTSTMYALGNTDQDFSNFDLYTINLTTGAGSFVGNVGYDYTGLACSPAGTLYTYNGWIHTINKSNGTTSTVGNAELGYAAGSNFPNLEFDITNNVLYLSGAFDSGNNLYTVNTSTGLATLVGAYPNSEEMLALAIPESTGGITNDIAVQTPLVAPVTGFGLTSTEQVTITVSNEGTASQSNIPVSYTINGGTPVNETIAGPIAGGNQLNYTFTQTADLSNIQSFTIVATASLAGDEVSFNNSINQVVTNQGYAHDLAALSVNGPSSPFANTPATFTVYVKNEGGATEAGASYTVVLYNAADAAIETQNGLNIASGEVKSFDFATTFTTTGSTYIYAKVFLTGDLNPSNDQTLNLNIFVQEQSQSNAGEWTSTGPDGVAFVNCLGGEETNLFLGMNGGLYRTTNYGSTWENTNLTTGQVNVVKKIGTSIFVGAGGFVYRSDDNGATWANKSTGLPGGMVKDFEAAGSYIFAGLNSSNTGWMGVFRSSDNGETWTATANTSVIDDMIVSGTSLFAGGPISGLSRSNDFGVTWTSLAVGDQIFSLAANSTTVFAGTYGGVYRSTNNGTSWTQVSSGYINSLSVQGTDVFAAVFQGGASVSTDNGASWSPINTGLSSLWTTAVFAGANNVFIGSPTGVSRSTNNGSSWFSASTGLHRLNIGSLIRSGNNIYATSGSNLNAHTYLSTDDGATWIPFKILNERVTIVSEIGINALLAKTSELDGTNLHHYLSFDNGINWALSPADLTNPDVYSSLATIGSTLFASIIQPDFSKIAFKSTDNGANWTVISSLPGEVNDWNVTGSIQFASTGGNSLYRSTDNGLNWTACSGMPPTFSKMATVTIGSKILMGLNDFGQQLIYQSTDNGATWSTTGFAYGIARFILNGSDLYAVGNALSTIYHSANSGVSWTDIGANAGSINRNSLSMVNSKLFVGKQAGGVFVSNDKGVTWFNVNSGFTAGNLPNISSPFGIGTDHLIAATTQTAQQHGQSTWRRDLTSLAPPAQPSAINGSATPCVGASYTYSVTNVPGVTYTWQFPAGWVINSGATTSSVEVTVGATPGVVLVTPSNEFGSGSAQFLVVTPSTNPPAQPSAITGPASPLEGSSQDYSVVNDPGVSYAWVFPSGWVQTGGGTTNAVTVTVGNGAGNITVTPSTLCGNGAPRTLAVSPELLSKTLNLSVLLEGLYDGSNRMREANGATSPQFGLGIADHITVELHDATAYGIIVQSFTGVELDIYGNASVSVPNEFSGSYYLTIKHRNSIVTVSANPLSFAGSTITYAFDAPAKAFGGNLQQMIDGTWVIFGGDVNQDGTCDSADMSPIDNDSSAFAVGYLLTDVNGDGTIDSADMTIVDNNSSGFVSAATP